MIITTILFFIIFYNFSQKNTKPTNNNNVKNTINKNKRKNIKPSIIKQTKDTGNEFIAIDIKTNNSLNNKITEIAAIKYSNYIPVEVFTTPIYESDLNFNKKFNTFIKFLKSYPIIGFDIKNDIDILKKYFNEPIFNKSIDILSLSKKNIPNLENYTISTISNYLNINIKDNNHSVYNAKTIAEIYIKYLNIDLKEKQKILNNSSTFKQKIFFYSKKILKENNKPVSLFSFNKTTKYFDLLNNKAFARFKLTSGKKYLITNYSKSDLKNIFNINLDIEKCPKSEKGLTRIILNNPEDIFKIDNLLIQLYDDSLK